MRKRQAAVTWLSVGTAALGSTSIITTLCADGVLIVPGMLVRGRVSLAELNITVSWAQGIEFCFKCLCYVMFNSKGEVGRCVMAYLSLWRQ